MARRDDQRIGLNSTVTYLKPVDENANEPVETFDANDSLISCK
jgi:hypothetical protein